MFNFINNLLFFFSISIIYFFFFYYLGGFTKLNTNYNNPALLKPTINLFMQISLLSPKPSINL